STTFTAVGGLAAADARCQQDASAAGVTGTFRALLSTTTMPALDRFLPLPAQPWVRVDGVATTRDFVTWDAPIDVTANGTHVNTRVFSGSSSPTTKALSATETCNNWN